MAYGLPATVAVARAPGLVSVTLVTLSALSRPVVVNSVPAKVDDDRRTSWTRSSAVTVRVGRVTVSSPST